ncbi:MAG TPA: hypothetical protein VG916_06705 [Gemmatimonadaceae bacterium]|nr:hypothetical protein [Gemmatimonadaceae bacterium]
MPRRIAPFAVALFAMCAASAVAQRPPAPRHLAAPDHVTQQPVGRASGVYQLADGDVLVNDPLSRRILRFDSTLATARVVADTSVGAAVPYPAALLGIIPFRGDSVIIVDPQSLSMLVTDGTGVVRRVMAIPRPDDAQLIAGGRFGQPGFDTNGRLVYRGATRAVPGTRDADGRYMPGPSPDSAPVVRFDFAARRLDTAGFFRVPGYRMVRRNLPDGRSLVQEVINPLMQVDAWVVTSDGRIALVRGLDYHVDWIGPAGERRAAGRMPYEWRRLGDDDKRTFMDSVRAASERLRQETAARTPPRTAPSPSGGSGALSSGFPGEGPPDLFVDASDLPDYAPPFGLNAVRADADGGLWIQTTVIVDGGSVYDVVNPAGVLTDRVVLPPGRVVAGFGRGGVVYLAVRDGDGVKVERARLR